MNEILVWIKFRFGGAAATTWTGWTCKSVRKLAQELGLRGHRVSHRLVAELLHELGYSLQANAKTLEGPSHPDPIE